MWAAISIKLAKLKRTLYLDRLLAVELRMIWRVSVWQVVDVVVSEVERP